MIAPYDADAVECLAAPEAPLLSRAVWCQMRCCCGLLHVLLAAGDHGH